ARHLADRDGIELPGEVVYVGGNDQPPAGHLVAHQLDGKPFPPRDPLHLGSDRAIAGEVHLSEAGHTELPSPVRTGSGSKGVISARCYSAGTPVVRESNHLAASLTPPAGWVCHTGRWARAASPTPSAKRTGPPR